MKLILQFSLYSTVSMLSFVKNSFCRAQFLESISNWKIFYYYFVVLFSDVIRLQMYQQV